MKESVTTNTLPSAEMLDAEYARMAEVEAEMWWYTCLHACLLASIRKVFGEDKGIRILDAGCGTGGFLRYLRNHGYENCVGLDISDIAVAFSRKQGFNVVKGSISDARTLAGIGAVDVIISMDVICSLPNEAERLAFFREAEKLLNSGGLMIVQTPAFACLGGIHDMAVGVNKRYTKHEMRKLLRQAGVENYGLRYRVVLLAPFIFLARATQRLQLKFRRDVAIESDVKMPAGPVNTLLSFMQRLEDRGLPLKPFGSSLQILVAKGYKK